MNVKRMIIGCGYVGYRLAQAEQAQGYEVEAFVTSKEKSQQLRAKGLACSVLNLDQVDNENTLNSNNAVIHYHVPPPSQGSEDLRMRHFIQLLDRSATPKRIVLISTTGVYGNTHGEWVNEDSPTHPGTDRAKRRLDAEQTLSKWCDEKQIELVILRVPGIYGPGRTPEARLNKPVINKAEAPYSNRIHVDDLVAACIRAAIIPEPLRIYNTVDDQPSTMTDYFNAVADHAGMARPTTITMAEAQACMSPAMLSYLGESRRIGNQLMREHLGVKLRYPNLRAGLAHCFQNKTYSGDNNH